VLCFSSFCQSHAYRLYEYVPVNDEPRFQQVKDKPDMTPLICKVLQYLGRCPPDICYRDRASLQCLPRGKPRQLLAKERKLHKEQEQLENFYSDTSEESDRLLCQESHLTHECPSEHCLYLNGKCLPRNSRVYVPAPASSSQEDPLIAEDLTVNLREIIPDGEVEEENPPHFYRNF